MAIIGISGANGVGKDTCGKIIQCLINGYTEHILSYVTNENWSCDGDWKIRKFATKVNDCYKTIIGIDFHSLSREDKELERPRFIKFAENCKEVFGERVWVDAEFRDYIPIRKDRRISMIDEQLVEYYTKGDLPNWIFTDVRYDVEFDKIKELGGIIIYVHKEEFAKCKCSNALEYENCDIKCDRHFHEDNEYIDYTICNNGTIEDLIPKVKEILIKEQICKE